jgi:hypothetical protein
MREGENHQNRRRRGTGRRGGMRKSGKIGERRDERGLPQILPLKRRSDVRFRLMLLLPARD